MLRIQTLDREVRKSPEIEHLSKIAVPMLLPGKGVHPTGLAQGAVAREELK